MARQTNKYCFALYEANPYEPLQVHMGNGHHQTWFESVEQARNSNCHGIYKDRVKYQVGAYVVTTIVDCISGSENIDPPTQQETEQSRKDEARYAEYLQATSGMSRRQKNEWRLRPLFPFMDAKTPIPDTELGCNLLIAKMTEEDRAYQAVVDKVLAEELTKECGGG